MDSKVAFITGANRGIGFETARELGEKGVNVIIGARDQAKGDEAVQKLKKLGIESVALQFDIDKPADHQKAFDYIQKNFGKLDILINNAGIWLDGVVPTSTTKLETLRKTFDTNFFNLVGLTETLLPLV